MDKHRVCKICNKRFANGKAMGGHMRSHLAKLPIPPKPHPPPVPDTIPKSPSSSSSLSNKNHMQSYRSLNRELVCCLPKSDLGIHDRESETESPRNLTRRRSKRRCRLVVQQQVVEPPAPEPTPQPDLVSSVTETFPVEDVAMCLVMLSRDKWPSEEKEVVEVIEVEESEEEEGEEGEDEDDSLALTKSQAEYKCETCNKVFRSYQALGGHRASHKNKKIKIEPEDEEEEDDDEDEDEEEEEGGGGEGGEGGGSGTGGDVGVGPIGVIEQKSFECPFCEKVFESGQGLGGHKKVHYSFLPIAKNLGKSGDTLIDLNLPAPEDDGEASYELEHSPASNADMSHPTM